MVYQRHKMVYGVMHIIGDSNIGYTNSVQDRDVLVVKRLIVNQKVGGLSPPMVNTY